jgi:hypothetical protein
MQPRMPGSRLRLWLYASAILLAGGLAALAEYRFLPIDYLPRTVWGPYLQDVRPDGITIAWKSKSERRGYVVYGPDRRARFVHKDRKRKLHAVKLRGLEAGRSYWYRVNDGGGWLGDWAIFRTAPRPDDPAGFTFAAVGDSGDGSRREWQVANAIARARPAIVIHTGDVVYPDGRARDYTRGLFRPFAAVLARAPFYPTMGNHDIDRANGQPYRDIFHLPVNDVDGSENYYSFDYGQVHFVCLNSNSRVAWLFPNSPQWRWLERDLRESRARWKIVYFHHPPFSSTKRGGRPDLLNNIVPLLERGGVDLVLNGHAHAYERTEPIRVTSNGRPVVYLVTGGGGGGLVDVWKGPHTAYARRIHHFVLIHVTPEALIISAVEPESGAPFDRAVIRKDTGAFQRQRPLIRSLAARRSRAPWAREPTSMLHPAPNVRRQRRAG